MGSSVFHGGFSTFLAISVLGPSKSYVFEVFFKCWVCIIVFGMANGFLLLPIILSYIGPHEDLINDHSNDPQVSDSNSEKTPGVETSKQTGDQEIDSQRSNAPINSQENETRRQDNIYDSVNNRTAAGSTITFGLSTTKKNLPSQIELEPRSQNDHKLNHPSSNVSQGPPIKVNLLDGTIKNDSKQVNQKMNRNKKINDDDFNMDQHDYQPEDKN